MSLDCSGDLRDKAHSTGYDERVLHSIASRWNVMTLLFLFFQQRFSVK